MKTPIYIPLVLAFLLFSCTKFGRNITIKGKVVNPITGTTYSDLKVQLVKSQSLSLPGGKKEIKHTFTDENGGFELNATRLGKIWVQIQSGSDLYVRGWYQDGKYISDNFRTTAQKRETMEADFHVVPYGGMKISIYNVNCGGASDELILEVTPPFPYSAIVSPVTRYGCYNQEGSPSEVPMGNYEIKWTIIRGGTTEVFSENLFVPENGIGELTINY
ncbi:MAG: hypothetical protein ACQERC_03930 [Bacteroidota bacterium]